MTPERAVRDVGPFEAADGTTLPHLELAYEARGDRGADGAVLVFHDVTDGHYLAGPPGGPDGPPPWWDAFVGPGKPVDTRGRAVVSVNVPGSCFGSTGPAAIDPGTGRPYGPDFPAVTVGDWARAARALLDGLGVGRPGAVVGVGAGGMAALEWAKRYPDDAGRVAALATGARLDPQGLAVSAIARRAVLADPNWRAGRYDADRRPRTGLALAWMLRRVRARTKASLSSVYGRRAAGEDDVGPAIGADPHGGYFPYRAVEAGLDRAATAFAARFDANSLLYLSRAEEAYDLAAGYGSAAEALAAFGGEALVLSIAGDVRYPPAQGAALARAFRDARVPVEGRVVSAADGHAAIRTEPERVGPPLRAFLDGGVDALSRMPPSASVDGDG